VRAWLYTAIRSALRKVGIVLDGSSNVAFCGLLFNAVFEINVFAFVLWLQLFLVVLF
jgi:hypothetical protein